MENTNVRVEQQVITTLFLEERSRFYLRRLYPQVFSDSTCKTMFTQVKECYLKNMPLTLEFMMANYGKKFPALEAVTIFTDETMKLNTRSMHWAEEHLKELYFLRLAMYMSQRIAVAVRENNQKLVMSLAHAYPKVHKAIFLEALTSEDHLERAVEVINSTSEYIPFHSPRAKSLFGGWTKSDVSSCGGKSGHNKTTFILFDAKESIKQGTCNKILYFSVDETGEKIARRIIANECGVSLSSMRNKTVTLDYKEIKKAVDKIFKDKFIIIDDLFKAEEIQQAVLDLKPDRFIIDHIQELDFGNDGISDQKVMVASKFFKEAAKLTHSNGTIISQVRDKLIDERFEDKVPRPHDFLYASDLRRKSREQTVVYWEYKDKQDTPTIMPNFDFIIWKSTYSDTGKVRFIVHPDYASFEEREIAPAAEERTEDSIWRHLQ